MSMNDKHPWVAFPRGVLWKKTSVFRYGFFFLSTLLPITPPRMPPTAAPIKPPFTLLRLVAAPMTAPAAAPMAASRLVFFTTVPPLVVVVVVALPTEPLELLLALLPLDRRALLPFLARDRVWWTVLTSPFE